MKTSSLNQYLSLVCFLLLTVSRVCANNVQASESKPSLLELPTGFRASLFCDPQTCSDIQCLTTDAYGNLVASGPGYIRILIDTDKDGQVDVVREFASTPKSGAQGLFVEGTKLYCIGDNGLFLYRDENRDFIADDPPKLIRKFKAGGKHHTHAIRKGPDGWWYLIAGNMAEVHRERKLSSTTPITAPHAGMLFRLSPDFSQTEILTDGFRNAYDFDFDSTGDLFTFDSDGERDTLLPWYRPTRIFHAVPGMNAGWVSRSWKKPNYFEEMTPVLKKFGRGFPTGVACYRHHQFPKEFQAAMFVLDRNHGRIFALRKRRQGASWVAQSKLFASAQGDNHFAPTDAVVGQDGSLYVCVGGPGAKGSIFRISYSENPSEKKRRSDLDAVLNADQPLSAWSRAQWEPKANLIGEEKFILAALNKRRTVAERIRALEILTELFQGPDVDMMKSMRLEENRELRARAVWAYGRSVNDRINPNALKPFLNDRSPIVIRNSLEVLLISSEKSLDNFTKEVAQQLSHKDRVIGFLASQVAARMSDNAFQTVGELARKSGWRAAIAMSRGFVDRGYIAHPYSWHDIGLTALQRDKNPEVLLSAVLLIQHGLAGFGYNPQHASVFDSYVSRLTLPDYPVQLDALRQQIVKMYPTGNPRLDWELGRLAAMISPANSQLLDNVLKQITPNSHPVSDLHHLIISSRLPVTRTDAQSKTIALAILNLNKKIEAQKITVGKHWKLRVEETKKQLAIFDQSLPVSLLKEPPKK